MDIERLETRDMRDELESLRAENAGLREKHQWISVKDRMPEPNTEVLIFIPDGGKGFICTDEICHGDWLVFTAESITHWCYLPEPPESEGCYEYCGEVSDQL